MPGGHALFATMDARGRTGAAINFLTDLHLVRSASFAQVPKEATGCAPVQPLNAKATLYLEIPHLLARRFRERAQFIC